MFRKSKKSIFGIPLFLIIAGLIGLSVVVAILVVPRFIDVAGSVEGDVSVSENITRTVDRKCAPRGTYNTYSYDTIKKLARGTFKINSLGRIVLKTGQLFEMPQKLHRDFYLDFVISGTNKFTSSGYRALSVHIMRTSDRKDRSILSFKKGSQGGKFQGLDLKWQRGGSPFDRSTNSVIFNRPFSENVKRIRIVRDGDRIDVFEGKNLSTAPAYVGSMYNVHPEDSTIAFSLGSDSGGFSTTFNSIKLGGCTY